ncbi:MAG: hypothetical protein Q9214_002844 [Letrouitia sp. 1 TL-2023]
MDTKPSDAAGLDSVSAKQIQDEDKLAELGYRQELNRDWSLLHNFGVSFSIISVITGITTYGIPKQNPSKTDTSSASFNMASTLAVQG